MYTLRFCLKSFFLLFLFSCQSQVSNQAPVHIANSLPQELILGAERVSEYGDMLRGKRVGVVANQTSVVKNVHLVDTLLRSGIDVRCVFSPEHGFRGDADAGESVASGKDAATGLTLISLYGKNKKPLAQQLQDLDILVFDIQDVGARFYTYISTLHYVMEAAAENNKQVLVLDRPNPNGHYIDGPVRQEGYTSFVGMHPIPIVHGMTIAEYALMINGESWLENGLKCDLSVVLSLNYSHSTPYVLPVAPSPNLRTAEAVALYPSLCLFEGTVLSEGRGTDSPFEVFGHPKLPDSIYTYTFTPVAGFGSNYPKLENQLCYGLKLSDEAKDIDMLNIEWIIDAYANYSGQDFFITKNRWFDLLAGGPALRTQISKGKTAEEIRASWQEDLDTFKRTRSKYLRYD